MNDRINVPVMIDTGDLDADFILNNISPGMKPDNRSSIVWLVRQQGYSTGDLMKELSYPGSGGSFLSTVRQELEGCYFRMSTLTFLVTVGREDLKKLKDGVEKKKRGACIRLSKETACGLFNPWDGAGSMFGIRLEKDLVIPLSKIWSCEEDFPAPAAPSRHKRWWYGVDEVCGLPASTWERGAVLETGGLQNG